MAEDVSETRTTMKHYEKNGVLHTDMTQEEFDELVEKYAPPEHPEDGETSPMWKRLRGDAYSLWQLCRWVESTRTGKWAVEHRLITIGDEEGQKVRDSTPLETGKPRTTMKHCTEDGVAYTGMTMEELLALPVWTEMYNLDSKKLPGYGYWRCVQSGVWTLGHYRKDVMQAEHSIIRVDGETVAHGGEKTGGEQAYTVATVYEEYKEASAPRNHLVIQALVAIDALAAEGQAGKTLGDVQATLRLIRVVAAAGREGEKPNG